MVSYTQGTIEIFSLCRMHNYAISSILYGIVSYMPNMVQM